MEKILIVYFSHRGENYAVGRINEGNAEHIAKVIQTYVHGDILGLEPVAPYSDIYQECVKQAVAEFKNNSLPEIKFLPETIDEYKIIVICYPNWCGSFPRIVLTFLNHYDFSNKVILPMCTHEGSKMGHSLQELKTVLPNSQIKKGLAVFGHLAHQQDEEIKTWLDKQLKEK